MDTYEKGGVNQDLPIIHIHFTKKTVEQKRKLVKMLTDAVVESLFDGDQKAKAKVYIYMHEFDNDNFARAGYYAHDGPLPEVILKEKK